MLKANLIKEIEPLLIKDKNNYHLPPEYRENLNILFSDKNIINTCKKIVDVKYCENINYEQLKDMVTILNTMTTKLNDISEQIDIYLFLREGYQLDYEGLMEEFKKRGLKEQYPDFDLKVLVDYYKKPPMYIHPYYNPKLKILVDKVVFRKYIIAVLQMVFNEMDLLIAYTGTEGAGKSTLATQHILLIYKLIYESKIIHYPYKIKDLMFNSLLGLRQMEDDHFSEKFRILALDEGNELHRQNWKEEEVQTFFQRLRRERFNQRIKMICIPVLGELMTNIIMTRVNFIFEVSTKNKVKKGILEKGDCNFYIIPRGYKIYSYKQKKELTKDNIKSTLYENLKDKSYLKGIPKELIVRNFKFNGVSSFKKTDYIKEMKESNKSFSLKEGIKLNNTTMYMLYRLICRKMLKPKTIGLKAGEPEYASFHKLIQTIRTYFMDNPRAKKNEEEKFIMKYSGLNPKDELIDSDSTKV